MSIPDLQPSGGFTWAQAPWGPVLQCGGLLPSADHFFTAASLRLKDRPDEWQAVAEYAGVQRQNLLLLRQIHGNHVVTARAARTGLWRPPEADAIISDDVSAALVIQVADCAPILLTDTRRRAVAAIHAGWRSTVQRIVARTVAQMAQQFGSQPADLIAAIGPSLGACCGEMGEEVVAAFRSAGHEEAEIERWFTRAAGERPHFNLWDANRDQLVRAGLRPDAIHIAALCTRTHKDVFHSYRATGPGAGRMAAVIRV
ncbi:MAG: peptidoglycan editing factor PgeF [Vicinamibacterales bacterium]